MLYCFIAVLFPLPVLAADDPCKAGVYDPRTGALVPGSGDVLPLACLGNVIARVVEVALVFLGVVTLLFLLYGAIRFIVSRGDAKAVEGARNTITYAIIGAVLVLGAFIIVNIVTSTLGLPNILTGFTLYQK